MRKTFLRMFAVFFSLAIAILCAELYVRFAIPQVHDRFRHFTVIDNFKHFIYNAQTGWRGRPNFDGKVSREEFFTEFHQNSLGFRGDEFPQKTDKKRIIALGDSFVWGWGVKERDVFTEIINSSTDTIELLNMGVPGYGTDQELLLAQDMAASLSPDSVFLFYYINDTLDNMVDSYEQGKWQKPYFTYTDTGQLEPSNLPIPDITEKLSHYDNGVDNATEAKPQNRTQSILSESYVAAFLADRLSVYPRVQSFLEKKGVVTPYSTQNIGSLLGGLGEKEDEYWKKTADLMSMLSTSLSAQHIPFTVFYLPYKQQIYPETIPGKAQASYDLDKPQRKLEELLRDRNVAFVDLTSEFSKERSRTKKEFYYRTDEHFNPDGHALVSELVSNYIRAMNTR